MLNSDLIGSTSNLKAARGILIKKLNQTLGENIQNVDELVEVMKKVKQTASQGSIGEHFAFSKKLFGSDKDIMRSPHIDAKNLGLKNPTSFNPDQLIFNKQSGKFGEVKTGYASGKIDTDQVDNYVSIFQNRFKPEYAEMFKKLGIKPEEFKGVEYLVLPTKAGESAEKVSASLLAISAEGLISSHSYLPIL